MKEKEKELLNSLYQFYVGSDNDKSVKNGDEVTYNKPDSKHDGKTGIFTSIRSDDGKYRLIFDGGMVFFASPKYVKKIDAGPPNLDKLYKILNQMVADGDLSKDAMEKFVDEIEFETKKAILDPFDEESWEEERDLIIHKPEPKKKFGTGKPIEPSRNSGFSSSC